MIDTIVAGRYRIVRHLGQGGMGAVYEATDGVTSGRVAVKVITAETARNATLMGRFEREARATMPIDTPHIVKVLDAGSDKDTGLPFIVMELLEGEDVSHLIKRVGPLSPDLALRLVAQACLGLQRAHDARIIHRDIKPANLFLARGSGGERIVKLLDFGIAKITRDPADSKAETAGLTRTGSMLGSPLYMSPEQARGLKEIDLRADIWSLGVLLYQALTGRTPHQDSDALGELIIAICTEIPAPIQELAPWVPPSIAAVAHGAMRFDPAERYPSAATMLDAIRPLLPDGWSIDESMFAPLGEVVKNRREPRFETMPDTPIPRGGRTRGDAVLAVTPPSSPQSSLEGFGKTTGDAAGASAGARAGRGVVVAATAAALLAGGALAYQVTRPAPVPSPGGVETAKPAPSQAPVEATSKPRTVELVVLPDGATVEVDGTAVTPRDGVVDITGPLGSVHQVRVSSGGEETTGKVVVTEAGALPAKIQLDVKAKPAPAPSPGPAPHPVGPRTVPSAQPDLRFQR